MGKKRPKKKTRKTTKAGTGSPKAAATGSREPVRPPEARDVGVGPETPERLLPPGVSWRDDGHAQKARAPKRVQRRIERITKWVWRSIPDREQRVISLARHDILLMSGPVAEGSPDRPLDEISKFACWNAKVGILLNVEGEASDPKAEERFSFLIAHELAHAYLRSASCLINAGADLLPGTKAVLKSLIPTLRAIAAAYDPISERNRDAEEIMATALAMSWGFGSGWLAYWMLHRQARGITGKDADAAGTMALFIPYGR